MENQELIEQQKIEKSINFLNFSFSKIREKYFDRSSDQRNDKNTLIYKYEVEFSYIINEIQMGPPCLATKYIADGNALIDELNQELQ